MANIKVESGITIYDGLAITFRSPVDCSSITGLKVYYPNGAGTTVSKEFVFADAHNNELTDISELFKEDVIVKVILDTTLSKAFVQNADTNAYLEEKFRTQANNLSAHTSNKSNPHGVTKSQVGLGNVPNVATNDQTPTFTQASTLAGLTSGEKLSVSFGKIMKAIADLISHLSNKNNPHGVTASQISAVPTSRTVNGKALSSNITLSAGDVGASAKATHTLKTLLAASWAEDGTYSLTSDYPSASYDIEVSLSENATIEMLEAFGNAGIVGNSTANVIKALGDIPEIDIEVIVKAVSK